MFMLTFSVNFNVNIVGVQPFIQCKIAGGFYGPHSATFYVPLCDLFLNIERQQLKYLTEQRELPATQTTSTSLSVSLFSLKK